MEASLVFIVIERDLNAGSMHLTVEMYRKQFCNVRLTLLVSILIMTMMVLLLLLLERSTRDGGWLQERKEGGGVPYVVIFLEVPLR